MSFKNHLFLFIHLICPLILSGQIKCPRVQIKPDLAYAVWTYNYKNEIECLDSQFVDIVSCALSRVKEINQDISFLSYPDHESIVLRFFEYLNLRTGHDLRDSVIVSFSSTCEIIGNCLKIRKLVFKDPKEARREYLLIKSKVPTKHNAMDGSYENYFFLHKNSIISYLYSFDSRMKANDLAKFLSIPKKCSPR